MPEEKNQERILGSLLESSKTTAKLASELNYIGPKGNIYYCVINRDLKKLEKSGFIESKKKQLGTRGRIPTLYSLNFNLQNVRYLLEKYPNLISKIQKNPFILESILELNTDDTISEEIKADLKKMMQLSPTFFRYLLIDNDSELLEFIENAAEISIGEKNYELSIGSEEIYKVVLGLNILFKECVKKDFSDGCSSKESIKYVKEINNKPSEAVIRIFLEHHSKNKDATNLRGKRVITVKTPKLREIFQQNLQSLNRLQS